MDGPSQNVKKRKDLSIERCQNLNLRFDFLLVIPWIYPLSNRMPVTNEGLVLESLVKM